MRKQVREENEKIEISAYVLDELNRFNSPVGIRELERANSIINAGINGFINAEYPDKKAVKSLTNDKEEIRRMLSDIRDMEAAKKTVAKYYSNGIEKFDSSVFEKLYAADDENEEKIKSVLEKMKAANESGNKADVRSLKSELKDLRIIRNEIKREIKKATKQNSIYNRAARPYIKAVKLIAVSENYKKLDEIIKA